MSIRNINFNEIQTVTATATAQKIINKVVGRRDVLQIQNQGNDPIGIFYSQKDVDNDLYFTLLPGEWMFFDDYIMLNEMFVKSTGADAKVVYIVNQAAK